MSWVCRFGRLLTLVAAGLLLLTLAACGKQEGSLANRRAAIAARNAQLLDSPSGPAAPAPASPRPQLVGDRDVGVIVGRGLFSPLVRPESPSARTEPGWIQSETEGIPVTFLEPGAETPMPGAPSGPGGPPGPGEAGKPSLGEASSCELAITGVVRDPNGYRLLVRHIPSGKSRWVAVGEEAFGYRVEMVTLRGALVSKGDRYYVLPLGQNAGKTAEKPDQAAPSSSGEPAAGQAGAPNEGDALFYGSWSGSFMDGRVSMTISFREDHSGSVAVMGTTESFTWRTEGGMIHTTGGSGGPQSLSFRFENENRALALSGGQLPGEIRLSKQ